ncbi:MAG: response regulator [Undibacterium sp.]|nr:response regulator [Undibacterium sp.]
MPRILLVDDDEFNQEIALELLVQAGYEAQIAINGMDAVEQLTNCAPDFFQLILMDLEMPIKNGYAATTEIRAMSKFDHIPIIALTSHTSGQHKEKCLTLGMQGYLTKPIVRTELYRAIHACLSTTEPIDRLATSENQNIQCAQQFHFTYIDAKYGLQSVGGKLSLYQHLLQRFREVQNETLDQLTQLSDQYRDETFARHLHTLKGLSATLGATDLTRICTQLETLIQSQTCTLPIVRTYLTKVTIAAKQVFEDIDQYFSKNNIIEKSQQNSSVNEYAQIGRQLENLLRSADVEASALFNANASLFQDAFDYISYQKLCVAVENYDFETAQIILKTGTS